MVCDLRSSPPVIYDNSHGSYFSSRKTKNMNILAQLLNLFPFLHVQSHVNFIVPLFSYCQMEMVWHDSANNPGPSKAKKGFEDSIKWPQWK